MSRETRVLVLEDEQLANELLADGLEDYYDCKVARCSSIADAQKSLAESIPDILVLDLVLGGDSLAVVRWVESLRAKDSFAKVPILFVSAYSDMQGVIDRARRIQRSDFLPKPFDYETVWKSIQGLLPNA